MVNVHYSYANNVMKGMAMKIYMVFCIRDEALRLIHAYQDQSKAQDMLNYLLDINSEDEQPMYVIKEVNV